MPDTREIHVSGDLRATLDPELIAQFVIMLGRQLAQETMTDGIEPGGPPPPPAEATG